MVELCESIRAHKVELANFELFSSTPKDVRVSLAGTYPAKEWELFGVFEAEDSRDVQAFVNDAGVFGKYVRVEVLSHHGSEHYCPVSMVKVYGVSELEIIAQDDMDQEHDHSHQDHPEDQEFDQQPSTVSAVVPEFLNNVLCLSLLCIVGVRV